VIVPVLSEAIQVVEPKVSKQSSFLIYTDLAPSLLAMTVKIVVTVVGRPSGTFATITMMNPLIKVGNGGVPLDIPMMKKIVPIQIASLVMNITTWWISLLS